MHCVGFIYQIIRLDYFHKKNYKSTGHRRSQDFWLGGGENHKSHAVTSSGGSRKFWGGIWSQNLKNSDVFTKIETDFSAETGNSNVFFAQNQVVSKRKKKKKRSSLKLRLIFRPKSEIQTFFSPKIRWSPKKKKKVLTKIETDFSAGFVTFRSVGGMHPEMEPNYSK